MLIFETVNTMESIFLDTLEIVSLTGRVKHTSQVRVLKAMGIEHKVRPDGSVAILRAHITKVFAGDSDVARVIKPTLPNWGAI